jgi:RNA polymerase sigma-70 factor, ECF subfamily
MQTLHHEIQQKIPPMIRGSEISALPTGEAAEIEAAKMDPARFSVLYNRYYEPVFRFAYQRLNSKEIAADICAQTFLKALTHLSSYKDKGLPFVCWLYRIAGNELKQLFRSNSRHRTINVETEGLQGMSEDMEDRSLDRYHDRMMLILPDLPEEELHLIEMRYFEKRPFKEIGDILEITENNAKVRLYRVLEKLKKRIMDFAGSETSKDSI